MAGLDLQAAAQKGETAVTSGLIHMKNSISMPASMIPAAIIT